MPHAIKGIRQEKIYIASCLNEGKLINFANNIVTIGFPKKNTFHKESLEKTQNRELIESHFSKVMGEKIRVEFVLVRDDNHDSRDNSSKPTSSKEQKSSLKKALSDPIIQSALDIFDGNIMKFM